MQDERDCLNVLMAYYQKNTQRIDTNFRETPILPIYVGFKITELCNQYCKHCWAGKNTIKKSKEDIFNAMEKLKKLNILHFTITGGEPLIRKDFLEIVKYAVNSFSIVEIFTNAQALDEEMIINLKKILRKNDFIQISLDGLKESYKIQRGVDSFDKVVHNIKLLNQYGINIRINTTTTNLNIDDIFSVYELIKDLNIEVFSLSLVYELRKGVNQRNSILLKKYETILNAIKTDIQNHPSKLIVRLFTPLEIQSNYAKKVESNNNNLVYFNDNILHWTIDAKGDIYNFMDHYKFDDLRIGNIYEDTLEILSENSKIIQRKIAIRNLSNEKCSICSLIEHCKGGDYICNYPHIHKADKRCNFNVKR